MKAFASIVGAEYVVERDGIYEVSPDTTEETAAVMALCSKERLVVTPSGGRTKLQWGNPVAPQVILNTLRLSGVREHVWQDLTVTVGAGTRWQDLQTQLAQHGQRVALDTIFQEAATVGGVLATNDSGLLRARYGSLRDLVLGMTIVLADGTIAWSGGKVVKNVAGYDLPKLLTGSFGTLGIITEATFRLHPIAQSVATFTVRSTDVAEVADLMTAVLKAGLSLEQMQLRNETLGYAVDLQFASLPEVLLEHEARLRTLAGPLSVDIAASSIFFTRNALFAATAMTIKVTALPSKLAAIVSGFAALNALPEYDVHCVADPVGVITASLTAASGDIESVIEDLRARLLSSGGSVVVLQPGALPAGFDRWGGAPAALAVMREIKQQFDPLRLLNPGRFVGGI